MLNRQTCLVLLLLSGCASKRVTPAPVAEGLQTAEVAVAALETEPFTQAWWKTHPPIEPEIGEHYAGDRLAPNLSLELPSNWELLVDVSVEEEGLPKLGGRLLHALPQVDAEAGRMDSGVLVDLVLPRELPTTRKELAGLVGWWLDQASSNAPWREHLADDHGPWEVARESWAEPVVMANLELPGRPRVWVMGLVDEKFVYILYAFIDVHPANTREILRTAEFVEG